MPKITHEVPQPSRRRFAGIGGRALLMVVVPLVAITAAGIFYLSGGRYVDTDNAYLKADKAPISSEVDGIVQQLLVKDNDAVHRGELLFRLDPASFRTAVQRAQARLAGVVVQLKALQSSYQQKQADIALAQTDLAYWQREADRQQSLARKGAVSESRLDEATHNADVARRKLAALKLDLQRIADQLAGGPDKPLEQHPDYRAAAAELAQAKLDLAHTEIRAPFDGHISQLPVLGQYLESGKTAALLVGDDVWVEANFIEANLTHVKPGQPVSVQLDIFPDHKWHGTVESLSPATGAEFAVIPAQNATGNWVKIPQRVPVRIHLDRAPDGPPLRAGLSAEVEVDTGKHCRLGSFCS